MSIARLLLVEDEFLIRMTLSEVLTEDGFEVVEADTGEAAIERLADPAGFAIMLADIRLPGSVDGRDLARLARARNPALPIVFMSGSPVVDAEPNPLDFYINKPYSPTAVSATVRRILNAG